MNRRPFPGPSSVVPPGHWRAHALFVTLTLLLTGCSDGNGNRRDTPPPAPMPNTLNLDVALSPEQVVGGGAAGGSATAEVTVNLDDGTVTGRVVLDDIDATGVALHRGFAGDRGELLVTLQASADDWVFPASVALTTADIDELRRGGLFLLATSAADPEGALRGQLLPEGVEVLRLALSGAQEVPPVSTPAAATAALTWIRSSDELVVHVTTAGLEDAVESHVHRALAGVNGPILTGLVQDPEDPAHWSLEAFQLDAAAVTELTSGALYLNVHTPAHPPGEVRGQIETDDVDVFFATLSGDDVVPPVATTAAGVAAATLSQGARVLDLHVNLQDADDATAVTVNQAPVMQNGPVALSLSQDPDALAHWFVTGVSLSDAQSRALQGQGLYVVVETPEHPDGALRGQLQPEGSSTGPGDAFLVAATDPDDGATVEAFPVRLQITFNRPVLAASAGPARVVVAASGGDGGFDDGNEVAVAVLDVTVDDAVLSADLDGGVGDDVYRITLDGTSSTPLTDRAGLVLDGDADGAPGGDFVATFTVDAAARAATLSQLQADVFTPSCAFSGCHGGASPAQGMNLSDGETFANVVGVPANEVPSLNRVEPGDPDASYLVRKIDGTASVGGRMPLGRPPLSNAQIQAVRDWVAAGAEDN